MEGKMGKKYALLFIVAVLLVVAVNFSVSDIGDSLVFAYDQQNGDGVVDKAAGDEFTVKITFKNTGSTEGNWSVNIAFEDGAWSQVGTEQNLVLNPGEMETLTWTGIVPEDAAVDSIARLVVYYNDSFKALDWWIHVVPCAELCIGSSSVE